ncbi:MAG TPA: hypothetical protein GXZ24_01040 [Firmicutes bacterium]|jgi:hypothetical protein|nr:hypothetical protein [Bacillota bacterium]
MKKIKSSLEIALERVGALQTDRKELEKLDEEKYLKAAASLGSSLLEGKTNKEQIEESMGRYPQEIRQKAFHVLANRLVEGVNLANTTEVLETITFLTDDMEIKNICKKTLTSFREHLDRLKKKEADLQEKHSPILKEKLVNEGFRGSALAGFNISGTKPWREALNRFNNDYQETMMAFKKQITRELSPPR